ncbi:MAG: FAD-binding oxidoreductase [Gemmataceae bacterium]|nr:FAD-binding oxidoreductase [Gemmataceae bacterium]
MSAATCDVAVLGAGIVGAACARALAMAGLRVAIVERATIGGGATAAGMGHVVVMDDSDAQFALTRRSQQLWDELSSQLRASVEYVQAGTLWIAVDDEELDTVRAKHAYYTSRGIVAEMLNADGVARAEPNLRPGLAGGLRVPGESVIYPPCASLWLVNQAIERNATLHRAEAKRFDRTTIELSDGSTLTAGAIVHATGIGATRFMPSLPIRPRKGHLVITDRYPGFARHQIVELGYIKSANGAENESVAFNLQPRKTGQMLLGSSRQYDVTDGAVQPHMVERMVARAFEYMPALARVSVIRTWTGFRAATPDSLPLIGPMPGWPGHFVATGHEGLGITTSLGTAELVVTHVTGQRSSLDLNAYLPTRFAEVAHG